MFYRKNHKTEDQEGSTRDVASSATYQDPRRMEPAYLYTKKTDFVTLCFYANLVKNIEYLRVRKNDMELVLKKSFETCQK